MARRDAGSIPAEVCDRGAAKQTALPAKTLRAAALLAGAGVGSALTARFGDARASSPCPQPKPLAAVPLAIPRQALRDRTGVDKLPRRAVPGRHRAAGRGDDAPEPGCDEVGRGPSGVEGPGSVESALRVRGLDGSGALDEARRAHEPNRHIDVRAPDLVGSQLVLSRADAVRRASNQGQSATPQATPANLP